MIARSYDDIVIVHSSRFTLFDMTGSFSPKVTDGLQSQPGSDNPPVHDELRKRQANGPFDVPYMDQTGLTRYAPMPKQPPTKISLKTAAPLYPTSAYQVAKNFLPTPAVQT